MEKFILTETNRISKTFHKQKVLNEVSLKVPQNSVVRTFLDQTERENPHY